MLYFYKILGILLREMRLFLIGKFFICCVAKALSWHWFLGRVFIIGVIIAWTLKNTSCNKVLPRKLFSMCQTMHASEDDTLHVFIIGVIIAWTLKNTSCNKVLPRKLFSMCQTMHASEDDSQVSFLFKDFFILLC